MPERNAYVADENARLHEAIEATLEESLEDLYENAPCGYLSTLPDGLIVKVNETLLGWTGYRRDDLVGRRRFQDLLRAGGRIYYETHYAPMLQMQGSVREIAVELVCADGRGLPVLVNSRVKRGVTGTPILVRTTVFDATERREYERELLRARQRAERSEARARILAQTLQESLIPPAPPQIPGLEVAAVYRPAGHGDEVGGDFYDVFETATGDWGIVLGDVRGKGAEAAAVTALARYTVRTAAMQTRRPKLVLSTLNRALLAQQDAERFCTVVYARIRRARERLRLTVASGGHPRPVLIRAEGTVPVGTPGTVLGVLDEPELGEVGVDLEPGDAVVFYTDGVTEGRSGNRWYGEERLRAALASARTESAAGIADRLVRDVVDFQDGVPRDDIAVVVLRIP